MQDLIITAIELDLTYLKSRAHPKSSLDPDIVVSFGNQMDRAGPDHSRSRSYRPFYSKVIKIREIHPNSKESLEILIEHGFEAIGIASCPIKHFLRPNQGQRSTKIRRLDKEGEVIGDAHISCHSTPTVSVKQRGSGIPPNEWKTNSRLGNAGFGGYPESAEIAPPAEAQGYPGGFYQHPSPRNPINQTPHTYRASGYESKGLTGPTGISGEYDYRGNNPGHMSSRVRPNQPSYPPQPSPGYIPQPQNQNHQNHYSNVPQGPWTPRGYPGHYGANRGYPGAPGYPDPYKVNEFDADRSIISDLGSVNHYEGGGFDSQGRPVFSRREEQQIVQKVPAKGEATKFKRQNSQKGGIGFYEWNRTPQAYQHRGKYKASKAEEIANSSWFC